ncbi:DUF2961 domain-containing protein [Prolixibacteraceae bacterium JC049]|nr:DUF2961 domain-containing protein [Prolixibacteraceae bacterium JC049]
MKYISFLAILTILLITCTHNTYSQDITTETLLNEMVNREALTRFPTPSYTCGQFSSYDRNSSIVDGKGWFANWDRSSWIRIEKNNGRREFVMMDCKGPGAITRFWITVNKYGGNGILRVYLDNEEKPVIEDEIFSLISGGKLAPEPLSTSVSKLATYWKRAHNLYLPIPYSKHCKVTYESDALTNDPGGKSGEAMYYNINYRTYAKATKVSSFSMNDLTTYKAAINSTAKVLLEEPSFKNSKTTYLNTTLKPKQSFKKVLTGEKAIRQLKLKLRAENLEQALRSTVLAISFDNKEKTVWCPIGDFFGTGYKLSPFSSFYNLVKEDGTLMVYWVMPFKNSCEIEIHNYGEQEVTIANSEITTSTYNWTNNSMYFGAGWNESYKLHTGSGSRAMHGNNANFFDLNYATLKGKGILVGTGVTLFNTVAHWWGEGDEKIYIDEEKFPSHFGTGTEDYYGYAWCRPEKFSHPFIAQPCGNGNLTPGYTVNQRYRGLDAIPFKNSLKFDMEIWHWAAAYINYAPTTMWYMQPGGISNLKENIEQVTRKVILEESDFYSKSPDEDGRIEAEFLKSNCDNGNIQTQSIAQFNWSNGSQVWWKDANIGSSASLIFEIEEAGSYNLYASLTKAVDYAIVDIKVDGRDAVINYDAYYANGVTNEKISLGKYSLGKGQHTLNVVIKGANKNALKKYMFGIDYIDVLPAKTALNSIKKTIIKAFPNPFSDKIYVAGISKTNCSYKIFNTDGKIVKDGNLITKHHISEIQTSKLANGIYILNIGKSFNKKLLKLN